MKIVQVCADENAVYGLGDDNNMYVWDQDGNGQWMRHSENEPQPEPTERSLQPMQTKMSGSGDKRSAQH